MSPAGRPRTGTPILVRIPAETLADIDTIAERGGATRATVIRWLLEVGIDRSAREGEIPRTMKR